MSAAADWNYPGARWWKFDFHTHTPASADTNAWQNAKNTDQEVTPQKWLLKYMAAEIDCVAITDHNSGEWIDQLKQAYAEMEEQRSEGFRELHLFPGVEISVSGGWHLLAIFDKTAKTSDIDSLLGAVGYAAEKGATDSETDKSSSEVVQVVLNAGAIPVPAHADAGIEKKGLLSISALTLSKVLENRHLVALEFLQLEKWKQSKNIGNRAAVLGSDCHSFQGNALPGSRYTWIKMAKPPSLEGLRLALLDGQDVSVHRSDQGGFDPFKTPEHFLESISIHQARYMGRSQSAEISLNPGFNALIGGRGTGKSTVIHTLRLAYAKDKDLAEKGEARETFYNFNKVNKPRSKDSGGLLDETEIKVILRRDGLRHRLIWKSKKITVEDWNLEEQTWQESQAKQISPERFKLRLFSQGQIAELSKNADALLAEIDFAAGTHQAQKEWEEAKLIFFSMRAKQRSLETQLEARETLVLNLQDIKRKLAQFESSNHAEILKKYQKTNRQSRELVRVFEDISKKIDAFNAQHQNILLDDFPEGVFDSEADALSIHTGLKQALNQFKDSYQSSIERLIQKRDELHSQYLQSQLHSDMEQAKTDYEKLKQDLSQQGIHDPGEYGRLVQEQQRLEQENKRFDDLSKNLSYLKAESSSQLEFVCQARRKISQVRIDFLKQALKDNLFVRISISAVYQEAASLESSLRKVLGLEAEDKFKDDIYNPEANSNRKSIVADFIAKESLAEFEEELKQKKAYLTLACQGQDKFGARFNTFLQNKAKEHPEFIDHIDCWFPEDGLQVEYSQKGDGRSFQSINQASAGQQAAAMLAFLLTHGDEPLVLDQPEDDLDNHLIYDLVVQQIRNNKKHRQLIIITHNPNIVVNGDAEMIHVMDFKGQCYVSQSGSLQDQKIRDEVCKIMEGGKDAFARRYQRLGRD
jgi:predicted ATPase